MGIKLDNVNDNALRQYFKRMVKSGDLIRFDTGIYYLPRQSKLLKKSYLDPLKVVSRKYIQNGSEIFGYFSGAYLANQLRLTTQMPATIEIVTNKESTKGGNNCRSEAIHPPKYFYQKTTCGCSALYHCPDIQKTDGNYFK